MRRSYISPEFINTPINGTFNMQEESNFFGSKMLEVEDTILINTQNVIYYQRETGEQIDLPSESSLPTKVYIASDSKSINQSITIDESQTQNQLETNTKWIIDVKLNNILKEYIFATLKRYRTFEGLRTTLTRTNDVDTAIKEYIDKNVMNRYKLSRLDLYISYKDLRSQNVLRYKNTWNSNITTENNLLKKRQIEQSYDGSELKILFTQEKSSNLFNFDYFFNILFEKI